MDLTDRINSLPDTVRRQILHAVCGTSSKAPRPDGTGETKINSGCHQDHEEIRAAAAVAGAARPGRGPTALPEVHLVAGACIIDDFIPPNDVTAALECARQALAEAQQQAAIGGALPLASAGRRVDSQSRGDLIRWLHPGEEAAAGRGPLVALTTRLEALRRQLERQGYSVGGLPTYQLACYPGRGTRYVRHADASMSCPTRTLTAIVYLNPPDWEPQSDGGCLALYNVPYSGRLRGAGVAGGEPATVVAPVGGRLLLFESHQFHEVLPTHRERYAVTAWFHRAPPPPPPPPLPPLPPLPSSLSSPSGHQRDTVTTAAEVAAEEEHGEASPPLLPPPAAVIAAVIATATASLASAAADEEELGEETGASGKCEGGLIPAASEAAMSAPDLAALEAAAPMAAAAAAAADSCARESSCQSPVASRRNGTAACTAACTAEFTGANAAAAARIFVSVAAYRDPDGPWTLHSLFSRADHPERVRVGVVWQIDPVTEASFIGVAGSRAHPEWLQQVRQVVLPYGDAEGPCKARALAQSLWSGEEYVLQLDAHMRLVSGWDTLCVRQLAAAEAASATGKAVLSTYPLGYGGSGAAASVPHEDAAPATLLCARGFEQDGFLRTVGRVLRERPAAPRRSHFWAAGLSFARSQWLQEVPYCPYLPHLFFGEESYMLARMWSRGWDVFAPTCPLAFHQWERSAREHTYQRDTLRDETQPSSGPPTAKHTTADATTATTGSAASAGTGVATESTTTTRPARLGEASGEVQEERGGEARRNGGEEEEEEEGKGSGGPSSSASAAATEARRRSQARVLRVLSSGGGGGGGEGGGNDGAGGGGGCSDGIGVWKCGVGDGDFGTGGWGLGEVWGLGTARSMAQLAEASGVDYAARAVVDDYRARWGALPENAFEL